MMSPFQSLVSIYFQFDTYLSVLPLPLTFPVSLPPSPFCSHLFPLPSPSLPPSTVVGTEDQTPDNPNVTKVIRSLFTPFIIKTMTRVTTNEVYMRCGLLPW